MATYLDLVPAPVKCGAMAPLNTEKGYACRCYDNMTARETLIQSVGPANVVRQDGAPMTDQDLSVPEVTVNWGGLGFGWRAVSGSNTGWYVVSFPLTLQNGDQITKSFLIPVVSPLG